MAVINGLAASVGWAGFTGLFAAPGYAKPYKFDLNIAGDSLQTTGFTGTAAIVDTATPGLRQWSGSITCRAPNTVQTGFGGLVSWGDAAYATNIKDWNLTVNYAEKDVTAFDGSGVTWRSFIPGIASWSGGFNGYVDDTTAITPPTAAGSTLAALTLKLVDNGVNADDTLAGAAMVTQTGVGVGLDGSNEANFSFNGSGVLTAAGVNYGVNSSGIFKDTAGTLITPVANTLTLTAVSGRTYVGIAFPTSLAWRVGVGNVTECVIGIRGSGALAIG